MRRRGVVIAGVSFVDGHTKNVIWQSEQPMSVGAALFKIAQLSGHHVWEVQLFNDCGLIDVSQDIDDAVVMVVFNRQ